MQFQIHYSLNLFFLLCCHLFIYISLISFSPPPPSEFAPFTALLSGCSGDMQAGAKQTIKAAAVPRIWTGQEINWPHGCLKAQRKQLHGVYHHCPHKICQPPPPPPLTHSSQWSSNDPAELWSGVTTQMTQHCVLMTGDVVSG